MNKTVSVLAITGTLAFAGAGAAQADTLRYNPPATSGTVDDATVAPGETVVFSSNEGLFTPGEIIDITVDRTAGTPSAAGFGAGGAAAARGGLIVLNAIVLTDSTKADAEGNFSYPVTLEEEGTYTLTAVGRESGATVTSVVVVDSDYATAAGTTTGTTGGTTTSANGKLANTGIDSAMLLWGAAGIGALGLGAGSIFVARRRAGAEA
ncbi:LPXTG-motif cell wall-anchored protein [Arthrobacter sp. CAN_A214]|uniref:LPXTG cell wall anchor domain-containing protein n=1 Tax=Arthrobacter sp. CAN_A214 TaxID=2787720 RepID=UPI0018C8E5B7